MNASRALVDEEHERLPPGEKDDNSYLLGRMGKHNVVIAFPGSVCTELNADSNQGGVLHYDMGKWKNDGLFHIESHLNKPPRVLLKAIETLQSNHDFGQGEMKQYIDEVAMKSTKLPALKDYCFPGRDQDQLFKANYSYTSGEDCLTCDVEKLEKRL